MCILCIILHFYREVSVSSFLTTKRGLCDRVHSKYDFAGDEGLDILETCWDELSKSVEIDLIVCNLVGQVELDKDVERLRRWRLGRELGREVSRYGVQNHQQSFCVIPLHNFHICQWFGFH